jgi:hypothetical protein
MFAFVVSIRCGVSCNSYITLLPKVFMTCDRGIGNVSRIRGPGLGFDSNRSRILHWEQGLSEAWGQWQC